MDTETKDPRISTTRVIIARQRRKEPRFIGLPAASSLVFLLSALCLLTGAYMVFDNLGGAQEELLQRLSMVGAVHGYEIALVVVAIILCRFQRFNSDAIGPVILGAAFCIGSAVTLDLVSIDAPMLTLLIGLGGCVFMILKGRIASLLFEEHAPMSWLLPTAGLITVNLLWPGIMGLQDSYSDSALYAQWWWLPAWVLLLGLVTAGSLASLRVDDFFSDQSRPFLRRKACRWMIFHVLSLCSVIHLVVLGYLHNIDVATGECLPFLCLIALATFDLRRRALDPAPLLDFALLITPIVAALTGVVREDNGWLSNPMVTGTVFSPAVVIFCYALGIAAVAYLRKFTEVMSAALIAASSAIIIIGGSPMIWQWHWSELGIVMGLALIVISSITYNAKLAIKACLLVTVSTMTIPLWWSHLHLSPSLAHASLTALCMSALCVAIVWQPTQFSRWAPRLTMVVFTIMLAVTTKSRDVQVTQILALLALFSACHAMLWWRVRDIATVATLLIPVGYVFARTAPTDRGWIAVEIAFLLLVVGTFISWLRVRRLQAAKRARLEQNTSRALEALEPLPESVT